MNSTENSTKLIAYIRVSTAEQGESGLGIAAQSSQIQAYAKAHGIEIVEQCVEVDSAVSGKRPVRFDVLKRCAAGEADGVIVASSSRISRSVVETADLIEFVERKGIRFVALDLGLDTSTPAGRMVASIMASVSQHEADLVSVRTRAALQAKKARGEAVSGPTVPAAIRELVVELRNEGLSLRKIGAELERRGIPTVRGGVSWHVSTVNSVLGYAEPRRRARAALPA
jgi:DNA invertase Pin-like site-specific DNA recombinase